MHLITVSGLHAVPPELNSIYQGSHDRIEVTSPFAGPHFAQILDAELNLGSILSYQPSYHQANGGMVPATIIYSFTGSLDNLTSMVVSIAGVLSRIFEGIIVQATVVNFELSVNGGPAILPVWTSDVQVAKHVLEHWNGLDEDPIRLDKSVYERVAETYEYMPTTREKGWKKPGFVDTTRLIAFKNILKNIK